MQDAMYRGLWLLMVTFPDVIEELRAHSPFLLASGQRHTTRWTAQAKAGLRAMTVVSRGALRVASNGAGIMYNAARWRLIGEWES